MFSLLAETNPKLQKWYDSLTVRRAVRDIDQSKQRVDRLAYYMLDNEFYQFIGDILDTLDTDNVSDNEYRDLDSAVFQ